VSVTGGGMVVAVVIGRRSLLQNRTNFTIGSVCGCCCVEVRTGTAA